VLLIGATDTERMIPRRSLCAAAAATLFATSAARARPADDAAPALISLGGIAVPNLRARLLARLPLGDATTAALAFGADLPEGSRDLLALAAGGRVVALEPLIWQGTDGSRLYTHLSAMPDQRHLRLRHSAGVPLAHGFYHEQWTDYLLWQSGGPLADAPVRPVLATSWQALLARQRAAIIALLRHHPWGAVTEDLLAACPPLRFPAVADR
jgi:hypothetical protein